MYTDWKDYFKPYVPTEEFIPDNIRSKRLSSLVFFIIIGFIASLGLVTKVETRPSMVKSNDPIAIKLQKIKDEMKSLESENTILESKILLLNNNISQMFESKEKHEMLRLSKLTGTDKQTGAGIVLTISDSTKPLKSDENPNLGIIHNTDLLQIVNDLWRGKANAISINGQRITASSEINCIGPAILINRTRISSPFIIKATGNPEKLTTCVKKGYLQTLELYGINYFLVKYERMEIPPDGTIILAGDF